MTGAVRPAFRPTFIVTAALALLAALILLSGALGRMRRPARDRHRGRRGGGCGRRLRHRLRGQGQETVPIRDPCKDRNLPDTGGITGSLQDLSLSALDRAACSFGSSREELLLALFDDRLQHKFEEEHGVNPRSAFSVDPGAARVLTGITFAYSLHVNETPTRREIIEQFIPNSPHAAQLGIRVASIGTDEAVLELPFKPELATMGEVVHGGAIGALIDTAAMAAAWATDEVPESVAGSTVSLSVNFASAASGVDLRAEAQVAKRGGRLSFCDVSVTDPEGTVVAHGIAT